MGFLFHLIISLFSTLQVYPQDIIKQEFLKDLRLNGKDPDINYNSPDYQYIDIFAQNIDENFGTKSDMWSLLVPENLPDKTGMELIDCNIQMYLLEVFNSGTEVDQRL